MNQILLFIKGFDRKIVLLAAGGLLLLLNLGRMAIGTYQNQLEEVEAQQNLLMQYQKAAAKLPALKKQVARLEQQGKKLEKYLFTGKTEEEISSAMQIMLQKMVTKSGMEPESIRPLKGSGGGKKGSRNIQEISIKIRLAGNLNQLIGFLGRLYRSKNLFKIENFTFKPYKQTEMKIFLDVTGFYTLSGDKK